MFKLVGYHR